MYINSPKPSKYNKIALYFAQQPKALQIIKSPEEGYETGPGNNYIIIIYYYLIII